jgi:hypothetical protein
MGCNWLFGCLAIPTELMKSGTAYMEVTYERNFDARVVYCVDHLFVKTEG